MQTFLPYEDFNLSAAVLDDKRLGKQRVEVIQILNALLDEDSTGWKNHPAVKMWEGYETGLAYYGDCICREWQNRGFQDTCRDKITDIIRTNEKTIKQILTFGKIAASNSSSALELALPDFLGNEEFHASHRSNLLRKDPDWYGMFGWTEPDSLEYYWPTKK
jgi:hypothetical protein